MFYEAWTATEPNGPGNGWQVGPAWLGHVSDKGTARKAKLIAAAPELLAAAISIEGALRAGFVPDEVLAAGSPIRAFLLDAIKKADALSLL